MTKKQQMAKPQTINKVAGLYTGAELRPYEGRPGAMDAFTKPSRVGDKYKNHRPPIGMASSVKIIDYAK